MTEVVAATAPAPTSTAPAVAPTTTAPAVAAPASVLTASTDSAVTTTESQGTAPATESQDQQQAPTPRAPEAYAEFVGLDEKPLLPEQKEFFAKAAKDMDLTQEQAQQLVKLGLERNVAQQQAVEQVSTKWLQELPSDKEFGGEKFQENMAIAKKAIDAFGTPELKQLLEQTKLGNNPELIRAFYRAGKQISPDSRFISGAQGDKPAPANPASALYPSMKTA